MSILKASISQLRADASEVTDNLEVSSASITDVFSDGQPVRLAITSENHPMLLVPAPQSEMSKRLPSAAGVELAISRYKVDSVSPTYFFELKCIDLELESVFLELVENICQRIRDGGGAVHCISTAISDFRRLLDGAATVVPDSNILGLFGELYLLKLALQKRPDAVNFWTGPAGGRRDFCFPGVVVEAKAQARANEPRITVSSIDQLEDDPEGELFVWHVMLEEDPGSGVSVKELVNELEQVVHDMALFEEKLSALGVTSATIDAWSGKKLRVFTSAVYLVDDYFPRVVRSSFKDDLPKGVNSLNYGINLELASASFVPLEDFLLRLSS